MPTERATSHHMVQILLPLYDNAQQPLPQALFDEVRAELVERFGGITTYNRAPARGLWKEGDAVSRGDIVVYEVMVPALDRGWWADYRKLLARRFAQEELMVRAVAVERL